MRLDLFANGRMAAEVRPGERTTPRRGGLRRLKLTVRLRLKVGKSDLIPMPEGGCEIDSNFPEKRCSTQGKGGKGEIG